MKEISLPTFINHILVALAPEEKTGGKDLSGIRRDRAERREFFYYKKVIDHDTKQLVGHLSDISTGGFKVDSDHPLPPNRDFRLSINLNNDVANKPLMVFVARSRWCKVDPIDPYVYNVGFQLVDIAPADREIFSRMIEKYSRENTNRPASMRRSNKW